jgi:tRNA threonylcarbamoyl adenosine modification protein YeaZ
VAKVNNTYLLAIESAIAGGSIALFKGKDFISGASGSDSVSRAEDLLPQIIHLLKKAGVERNAIDRIAISLGPGSYTGLRIGIATVLGLSRGLGIEHVGVPVFEAISDFYENCPGLIALPMGRSDICVVEDESRDARITSLDALKTELEIAPHPRYFAHSEIVPSFIEICPEVIDIGTNLARFVGTAALRRPKGSGLEPIYVQNPRFG